MRFYVVFCLLLFIPSIAGAQQPCTTDADSSRCKKCLKIYSSDKSLQIDRCGDPELGKKEYNIEYAEASCIFANDNKCPPNIGFYEQCQSLFLFIKKQKASLTRKINNLEKKCNTYELRQIQKKIHQLNSVAQKLNEKSYIRLVNCLPQKKKQQINLLKRGNQRNVVENIENAKKLTLIYGAVIEK